MNLWGKSPIYEVAGPIYEVVGPIYRLGVQCPRFLGSIYKVRVQCLGSGSNELFEDFLPNFGIFCRLWGPLSHRKILGQNFRQWNFIFSHCDLSIGTISRVGGPMSDLGPPKTVHIAKLVFLAILYVN